MKKLATVLLLAFAAAGAAGCRSASAPVKPKLMWLDCSANWERFSYPDSIRHYVRKCREAGMTALVLDIKGTSSEVVYPSEYAPRLKEWKGVRRPDFDFIGTFTDAAHASGMEIYGSFNTFAEGNGVFRRGLLYDGRPEWQAVNYLPGRGLVPQLEIPGKKVLFVNPALPEVQEHEIALFKEAARKYDLDGILLDRARYDNIQSDFSDFSREAFERYIGRKLERFPEDIYAWEEDGAGGWKRTDGPWFKKWIEWRASVIHGFFARTREELKAVKPGLKFGAYTGAWYPSYFEVGVNWASREYDPSQVSTLAALDSTRLRSELARYFGISPDEVKNCRTYGGHGEQMAVFASTTLVDGKPLSELIGTKMPVEDWHALQQRVIQGGKHIIDLRGRSSFQSPAYVSICMIAAAMGGKPFEYPAGVYVHNGEFDHILMAMETEITKDGVTCKDVQGTPEEHKTLRESYEHLCKLRDEVISMGIIPPVSEWGGLNPNLK